VVGSDEVVASAALKLTVVDRTSVLLSVDSSMLEVEELMVVAAVKLAVADSNELFALVVTELPIDDPEAVSTPLSTVDTVVESADGVIDSVVVKLGVVETENEELTSSVDAVLISGEEELGLSTVAVLVVSANTAVVEARAEDVDISPKEDSVDSGTSAAPTYVLLTSKELLYTVAGALMVVSGSTEVVESDVVALLLSGVIALLVSSATTLIRISAEVVLVVLASLLVSSVVSSVVVLLVASSTVVETVLSEVSRLVSFVVVAVVTE
jgi:hypothetical protein